MEAERLSPSPPAQEGEAQGTGHRYDNVFQFQNVPPGPPPGRMLKARHEMSRQLSHGRPDGEQVQDHGQKQGPPADVAEGSGAW